MRELTDAILALQFREQPVKKSAENAIYLRAFEHEDYKQIHAWRKDEEMYRLSGSNKRFVSSESDRSWVLEKMGANAAEEHLAICLRENERMIGFISLSGIDFHNSRAEISGYVIGEKQHRGKGYGTQALFLLLTYAFDELGLYRVSSSFLSENTRSLALGKRVGFRQEGMLRQHVYKGGRRHDVILMSLLRPEFEQVRATFSRNLPRFA